jgi:hypothetical protein
MVYNDHYSGLHQSRVREIDAAFCHHLNEIPETQLEPEIPSNAKNDDFPVEMAAYEKLFDAQHPCSPTTRSTANMPRSRRLHQNPLINSNVSVAVFRHS